MKKLLKIIVYTVGAIALGVFFAMAWIDMVDAQEITPEATTAPLPPIVVEDGGTVIVEAPDTLPTTDDAAITALVVGVGVVVALFLTTFFALLFMAWNHVPSWAQQLTLQNRGWIESRVDAGTDLLGAIASRTPNTLDDQIAKYVNDTFDARLKAFFDERMNETLGIGTTTPRPTTTTTIGTPPTA